MTEPQNNASTRRDLLRSVLRIGSLGTIGVCGAAALNKRQKLVRDGVCVGRGLCCNCDVFDDCGLPRALSAKLAKENRS